MMLMGQTCRAGDGAQRDAGVLIPSVNIYSWPAGSLCWPSHGGCLPLSPASSFVLLSASNTYLLVAVSMY